MQLHIGVLHEDQVPNALFQEFEESISAPGLIFERETRPSRVPFAGVEWLMPTVVLAYVAKPYFESFLKEMGKDHYDLLKKGFNKLYERFAGPRTPDVKIVATQGKSSEDQPYSLFFSIIAEAPDGVRLKLLIPRPIEQTEYEIAISKFLDFVQSTYDGDMTEDVVTTFKNVPINSGMILVTYETATGKLLPVDPFAGHRPQQ
ncbi:hypothetical protein [Chromobacterium phragmitis]|uniref:Uncharacterized protein n=1 Tax=Chromobacterium phragmitis TaxID=2202141 RepID=A0A344UNA3_9NEIS|nr:hypothetical protein [Chromobacterium phragmitis]AXE36751.1 hypothetical protein DK843_22085 [Chromobacterium phragmitis]